MKHRNNLSDKSENGYFRVVTPMPIFLLVGVRESNTYFGSSMMLGNVYKEVELAPGEEVHDLFGGVFATHQGKRYQCVAKIREKHPFEKEYGGAPKEMFRSDCLEEIPAPLLALPIEKAQRTDAPVRIIGRGIDSVLV